jgi:hypothetical protein
VTVRVHTRFGRCYRTSSPRWNPRRFSRLAVSLRQGSFDAAFLASVTLNASRKHPNPRFGMGSGEALCNDVRVCVVTCDLASCRTEASAHVRYTASISASSIRLRWPGGLPSRQRRLGPYSFGRALRDRKCSRSVRANGWLCPANTPPCSSRSGSRRLAAVVTLWSGTQGHGRSSVRFACISNGQSEDRKSSWPIPDLTCRKTAKREGQTNTALRSSDSISVVQVNYMRGTVLTGDS